MIHESRTHTTVHHPRHLRHLFSFPSFRAYSLDVAALRICNIGNIFLVSLASVFLFFCNSLSIPFIVVVTLRGSSSTPAAEESRISDEVVELSYAVAHEMGLILKCRDVRLKTSALRSCTR